MKIIICKPFKNSKFYRTQILICILSLLVFQSVAQTNVSGIINSNTLWNIAGSPYMVVGNVLVDSGFVLTIDPGVVVKVAPAKSIQIRGTLRAVGTATNKILFTSNSMTPLPGDWYGIQFDPRSEDYNFTTGAGNIFKNCELEYATVAIYMQYCTAYIDSNLFKHNTSYSINIDGGNGLNPQRVELTNNIFTRTSSGASCVAVSGIYSDVLIKDNIFCKNSSVAYGTAIALSAASNDSTVVSGNVIANNIANGGFNYGSVLHCSAYDSYIFKNSIVQNTCRDLVVNVFGNKISQNTFSQNILNNTNFS